jgi:hypothetical protein
MIYNKRFGFADISRLCCTTDHTLVTLVLQHTLFHQAKLGSERRARLPPDRMKAMVSPPVSYEKTAMAWFAHTWGNASLR